MSRVNRYEYTDWKGFGTRVKYYREQINMTNEVFAESINRSENYVTELQKGNVGCSVHTLHQISTVLRVPVDRLLYGEKAKMENKFSNKDILHEIINRCNEDELAVIKDVIVALYPNLNKVINDKNK